MFSDDDEDEDKDKDRRITRKINVTLLIFGRENV